MQSFLRLSNMSTSTINEVQLESESMSFGEAETHACLLKQLVDRPRHLISEHHHNAILNLLCHVTWVLPALTGRYSGCKLFVC